MNPSIAAVVEIIVFSVLPFLLGLHIGRLKSKVRIMEQNILISDMGRELLKYKPGICDDIFKAMGIDPLAAERVHIEPSYHGKEHVEKVTETED